MNTRKINSNPLVSVIMLNYNGKTYLKRCFESLKLQSYPNFEVIMVDNASTDDSVKYTKKNFPWVKVVQSPANLGFTSGNNLGYKNANGEYLIFLNNDTYVNREWLEELVNAIKNGKNVGMAQSLILDYEKTDTVQCAGLYLIKECGWTWAFCKDMPYKDFLKEYNSDSIDIFAGFGASVIIPKKLFEKIGGFDEKFFMYSDETDLSWRVRLRDCSVVLAPKSKVYHKLGASANKTKLEFREFQRSKNVIRMLLKNYGLLRLLLYLPSAFFLMFMRAMFYLLIKFESIHLKTLIMAILWNLKNIGDTLSYRKFIQGEVRKVDDNQVIRSTRALPLSEVLARMR